MTPDPLDLLRAARDDGSGGAMDAWAESGTAGLLVLRAFLEGRLRLPAIGSSLHPRDAIDNTSKLVARIAEALEERRRRRVVTAFAA
ncbi:MAG TPA: hypothetical protein VHM48_06000, partial [Candidatus Limnocylindrales bacterium]|nr:hypothetical protein [Candidatus Limnocylindrales bacterium]